MILTIALLTCVICLIFAYLRTIHYSYDYFKRHAIPGPPHRFFFGHCQDLWSAKSFCQLIQQWTQQYGSIYGIFQGTRPVYVVSDVDFLHEVYIKQFSCFHSRSLPIILRLQTGHRVNLLAAMGARWRRQRKVINPTFSPAKLKLMLPLLNQCIDAMLNKINESTDDQHPEMNIFNLYKRMTMDVICK